MQYGGVLRSYCLSNPFHGSEVQKTYSRLVARKVHQNGPIVTTGSGPEVISPSQEVDQNIVPIVTTLPVHYA